MSWQALVVYAVCSTVACIACGIITGFDHPRWGIATVATACSAWLAYVLAAMAAWPA